MPTIDLGKVRGEDGKDGKDGVGGDVAIELLEKPMLESEVYQAKAGSSGNLVTYPKWNIPIQIDKIKSQPKKGDIISIELESPYASSGGNITRFKLDFKCTETDTMIFADIPIPVTDCFFRICAIAEPNAAFSNVYNTVDGVSAYRGVEYRSYHFNDIVLLGGVDDFNYIHGLTDLLNYADEHCGGVIDGLGNTADLRKEIGNGDTLELIAFYSGDNVSPWWNYTTSAPTDMAGNKSCLWFLYPSSYNGVGSLPESYNNFDITQVPNSGVRGFYTGQYLIKSVRYKVML